MRCYLFLLASIIAIGVGAQPAHDLKRAKRLWQKPAQEYRMKTWWFFGYEQTTDEGITVDAEALRDAHMTDSTRTMIEQLREEGVTVSHVATRWCYSPQKQCL